MVELPKRKQNRLANYDYSSNGVYFVTICTEGRRNILCYIVGDGFPVPKRPGAIAEEMICRIAEKYPSVSVDKYVVMPNHIHLLLRFDNGNGTGNPSPTLGNVMGWYKYHVTKAANAQTSANRIFQRSYHDHIIRGEKDYLKIWEYIDNNPAKWRDDCLYTE